MYIITSLDFSELQSCIPSCLYCISTWIFNRHLNSKWTSQFNWSPDIPAKTCSIYSFFPSQLMELHPCSCSGQNPWSHVWLHYVFHNLTSNPPANPDGSAFRICISGVWPLLITDRNHPPGLDFCNILLIALLFPPCLLTVSQGEWKFRSLQWATGPYWADASSLSDLTSSPTDSLQVHGLLLVSTTRQECLHCRPVHCYSFCPPREVAKLAPSPLSWTFSSIIWFLVRTILITAFWEKNPRKTTVTTKSWVYPGYSPSPIPCFVFSIVLIIF